MEKIKCLIIGSGPAGYTAAIYASRAGLSPVLYEGIQPGGQLTATTDVENFPGYPQGVSGMEMMEDMKQQALRFGTDVRAGVATGADLSSVPYKITIDGQLTLETETLIIATGASARYLGLPDEQTYAGRGVSACATCDGFFYRKKNVAVVGGGDTACEDALYLSRLASQVFLIVRKPFLRASKVMQDRVFQTPNIQILFEHNTLGLFGGKGLEGAHLVKRKGEPDEEKVDIAIDGFFLAIGHRPESGLFKPWLKTDENGYILTRPGTPCTELPGVFAAGDVADPVYRQAVTAAANGCRAAIEAERYLMRKRNSFTKLLEKFKTELKNGTFWTTALTLLTLLTCLPLAAQDKPLVIAHRGYWQSRGSAQNSIAALIRADEIKAYAAEFDVHLTADDILVVNHDPAIEGFEIQKSAYTALKDLVLPNGEKIPTAREYLEAARRTQLKLVFELKPHATPERNREAAQISVELVKEKKLLPRTEFITFNLDAGKELIRLAPEADVYYLNGELSPKELKELGFAGLDYHYDVMRKNPQWFKEAKALGLGINVWTVNDTALIGEMTDAGADFITTDVPNDALKWIGTTYNRE